MVYAHEHICLSARIAQCLTAVGQCMRASVCMHVCFAMLDARESSVPCRGEDTEPVLGLG